MLGLLALTVAACRGESPFPTPAPEPTPRQGYFPLIDTCEADGYCGFLNPGGRITAATWFDDTRIYLASWEGEIRLLDISTGSVRTVLEGLRIPQGLAVLDGRLYVTDMGNVCEIIEEYDYELAVEQCKVPFESRIHERDFLLRSSAQIISFVISDDEGNLSDRKVVLEGITARGRDHSANVLVADGEYVYVSIGHPQILVIRDGGWIVAMSEEITANGGRPDLMGTIARFRPSDNDVEVYATGFRNVYGISIAPDGTIYGADNDQDEDQKEELNAIVQGGFYGFPFWGTNESPAPFPEGNVREPVAVLQGSGSTVAFANQDGVYVGYVTPENHRVLDRFDYEKFTPERIFRAQSSYITAVLERDGLLYLFNLNGSMHIIDPAAAPIAARTP